MIIIFVEKKKNSEREFLYNLFIIMNINLIKFKFVIIIHIYYILQK